MEGRQHRGRATVELTQPEITPVTQTDTPAVCTEPGTAVQATRDIVNFRSSDPVRSVTRTKKAVISRVLQSASEHAKKEIAQQSRDSRRYYKPTETNAEAVWHKLVTMQTAQQIYNGHMQGNRRLKVKNQFKPLDPDFDAEVMYNMLTKGTCYESCNAPTECERKKRMPKKVVIRAKRQHGKGPVEEYYTKVSVDAFKHADNNRVKYEIQTRMLEKEQKDRDHARWVERSRKQDQKFWKGIDDFFYFSGIGVQSGEEPMEPITYEYEDTYEDVLLWMLATDVCEKPPTKRSFTQPTFYTLITGCDPVETYRERTLEGTLWRTHWEYRTQGCYCEDHGIEGFVDPMCWWMRGMQDLQMGIAAQAITDATNLAVMQHVASYVGSHIPNAPDYGPQWPADYDPNITTQAGIWQDWKTYPAFAYCLAKNPDLSGPALRHVELFSDALILMCNSKNWMMALLQLKTYLCHICDTSISVAAYNFIFEMWTDPNRHGVGLENNDDAWDDLGKAVNDHFGIQTQASTLDHIESFRECIRKWNNVCGSEFAKRLKKMIAFIVALGACEATKLNFPFFRFEEYYATSGVADLHWSDLWTGIADTALFIFDKGLAWWKGMHWLEVIGSPQGATNFETKYTTVLGNIRLYETSDLAKAGLESHTYERLLDELEREVKMYHTKMSGPEKRIMAQKMLELARIRSRVVAAMHRMPMRMAPYSFYLYGTPGTGKTTAMGLFTHYLLDVNNFSVDPIGIVHARLDDAYQTEIENHHIAVVIDDIGATKAMHEKGSTTQSIIHYVNNNPTYALKADLPDKGRVMIAPKFFCGTGNTPECEAHVKSNEPLAILRRLGVRITVVVKEEFRMEGSNMIDPSKMEGIVNDAWSFTLEKPVPTGQINPMNKQSNYIWQIVKEEGDTLQDVGMERVLEYMKRTSALHFTQQEKLLRDTAMLHTLPLCEHKMYPELCSQCRVIARAVREATPVEGFEVQAGEEISPTLARLREWSYSVADVFPDKWAENRCVSYCYTRLNALAKLELGLTGMRVFCFFGGTIGSTIAALFSATTPVVVGMGMFLYAVSSVAMTTLFIKSKLKQLKNTSMIVLQPYLRHKYTKIGAAVVLGLTVSVATIVLMIRQFRPYAKTVGENIVTKLGDDDGYLEKREYMCSSCGDIRAVASEVQRRPLRVCPCKEQGFPKTQDGVSQTVQTECVAPTLETQGCDLLPGVTPAPDEVIRENVYAIAHVEPVKKRHQLATMTTEQMDAVASRLIACARFSGRGRPVSVCNAWPIKGNVWLMPYHQLARGWDQVEIIRSPGEINNNRTCLLTPGCWKRIGDTDLALASLVTVGEVCDTTGFLLDEEYPNHFCPVKWIYKLKDATCSYDNFLARKCQVVVPDKHVGQLTYPGWAYEMNFRTQSGFCMAALVSRGKLPYIVGFHSAGDSADCRGRAHAIYRQQVLDTYDSLFVRDIGDLNINVQVASDGDMELDFPEFGIKHLGGELHKKSPFNFMNRPGHVELYGPHDGTRRRFGSKVVETFISKHVTKVMGIERMHDKPKNMNGWQPWHYDADVTLDVKQLPQEALSQAFADLETRFASKFQSMTDKQKANIRPLSEVATLAGVDGVRGIDRMNLNTSAGFPRCKPKRWYIHETDEKYPNITCPLVMDDDIRDGIARIEKVLQQKIRVYMKFRMSLKDEPTKMTKDKVRTFAGGDIELLFLLRKYFLPIVKVMMDNPEFFECAVGVNAYSKEWTRLAEHIMKHGPDRNVAGDYIGYDGLMINQMVLLAFAILITCARIVGYSQEALDVMTSLATEVAHGLIEYNGEYVLYHSQNLSGHALTVFINNIVNSMYMRVAYYMLFWALVKRDTEFLEGLRLKLGVDEPQFKAWCDKFYFVSEGIATPPPFHEMVALLCYGDDNNCSVSKKCGWFNHTLIAYALGLGGVKYTMADKTSASVPFIRAIDSSFLKRGFVWSDEVQQYLAPLEEMSLYKTLHACVRSDFLTDKEQAAQALESVSRELFNHGKDYCDTMTAQLNKVIVSADLTGYFPKGGLPDYQYYLNEYRRKNEPEPSGAVVENGKCRLDTRCGDGEADAPSHMALDTSIAVQSGSDQSLTHRFNYDSSVSNQGVTSTYESAATSMTSQQQTMVFRDGVPLWESAIPNGWDSTREQAMDNTTTLAQFFNRPVVYDLPVWTPGSATPYTAIFNPWTLFYTDSRVVNRTSNFKLLQSDLHVELRINGSKFHYGKLMADYVPLHTFNQVDPLNTINNNVRIQASQRLKVFLDPTTSRGGHLHMPFIWPTNALDVALGEYNYMGQIYVRELVPLKHANAGTDPVSIQAYIWADNVQLSTPTTLDAAGIVPQAGDEYGTSPISTTASAVSAALGKLDMIPVIGPYAKATSMIVGSMGAVAKSFGFSRPPIIADSTDMHPKVISRIANTDAGDNVTKLTMDSKQELTIDPRVFGIDAKDELSIKHIAGIETYINQFVWPIATARGTLLWNIRVSPNLQSVDASYTPAMTWYPACSFAAQPFKLWRGTMRYRFQIVCSDFHRGRLRFVFDPNYVTSLQGNIAFSKIVDLTNERDFVLDVSMAQNKTYLYVQPSSVGVGTEVPIVTGDPGTATTGSTNGVLGVYVENDLVSPNSTVNNDIMINVFASMCDDVDFAVPTEDIISSLTYSTQAGDEADDAPVEEKADMPTMTTNDDAMLTCLVTDNTNDVYIGERVSSLRQLLRRYSYHKSVLCPGPTSSRWRVIDWTFPRYRGRWASPAAIDTPLTGTVPINNAYTTMLNYVTPAYVGVRGGIRKKLLFIGNSVPDVTYQATARITVDSAGYQNSVFGDTITSPSEYSLTRLYAKTTCQDGGELTTTRLQPVLEVEYPFFAPYRFQMSKDMGLVTTNYSIAQFSNTLETDLNGATLAAYDQYVAAGEDFALFLFNGAPPMKQTTLP